MNNIGCGTLACLMALVLCLSCVFCACTEGDPTDTDADTNANSVADTSDETGSQTETEDDGKTEYKVTVTDEDGNALAGVMVQLCLESCVPAMTDENGVATYNLPEADYKAAIISLPEGYEYTTDETEFYFNGEYSLVIVLAKAE